MALPDLTTPPEHIAAERAWREGRMVPAGLNRFKTVIQGASVNAYQMERYFGALIDLHGRLVTLIDSGDIDAAPTWKANLETARDALASLAPTKNAAFRKYGELAANLKATENAAGGDMTYQEAQEATLVQQADKDAMVAAVDSILL